MQPQHAPNIFLSLDSLVAVAWNNNQEATPIINWMIIIIIMMSDMGGAGKLVVGHYTWLTRR